MTMPSFQLTKNNFIRSWGVTGAAWNNEPCYLSRNNVLIPLFLNVFLMARCSWLANARRLLATNGKLLIFFIKKSLSQKVLGQS